MTEQELKDKYSKVCSDFLDDYIETPAYAKGKDAFGQKRESKWNVLDDFKATNAMFKEMAKNAGIKLNMIDTDGLKPPDPDAIDLG